jgi:ribonuclease P protein component
MGHQKHKLTATDEKDLSTEQSTTQTDARFPRANGDTGRTQYPKTTAGKGPQTAGDRYSAEAARLTGPSSPFGFKASDRLRRRGEFLHAQREGARFQTPHFIVYALRVEGTIAPRLGITVSRRIGGAVMRNRVKRRVRECFRRELRSMIPGGTDLLVIARTGAARMETRAILSELVTATQSLRRRIETI